VRFFLPLFMFRIYRGLSTPYGSGLARSFPPYGHYTLTSPPSLPPRFLSLPVSSGPPYVLNRM